ncbi:MAG: hypothetical protein DMD87_24430 [Candidatus Rokuibacteriota bacterium]|nr:MAG: hypothetical protein DMD87_24430 [Candidatus Rokubacteria bacterium]
MKLTTCVFAVTIGLTGCSSTTLPYKPVSQPSGVLLSADYVLLADRLRVDVDTYGYRLEDAQIVRPDNAVVRPQTIEQPPAAYSSGSSVGFGFGGGSWSGGRGGGTAVGTGVGVNIPIGGDTRVAGYTVLYFALDLIGPPPWRLNIKVAETSPAEIVLPPR